MSRPLQYVVNAHYVGEICTSNDMGITFETAEICRFKISRKATFNYLKDRIQKKIQNDVFHKLFIEMLFILETTL